MHIVRILIGGRALLSLTLTLETFLFFNLLMLKLLELTLRFMKFLIELESPTLSLVERLGAIVIFSLNCRVQSPRLEHSFPNFICLRLPLDFFLLGSFDRCSQSCCLTLKVKHHLLSLLAVFLCLLQELELVHLHLVLRYVGRMRNEAGS